jgi:hypothetical protein
MLERTGLTIDRIVKAINAPRVPKGSFSMKLGQAIFYSALDTTKLSLLAIRVQKQKENVELSSSHDWQ